MKIVVSAKMGPGTFEAKFIPLSQVPSIESIIVVRKDHGPTIPKVEYVILPRCASIKILNILITPLVLIQQVRIHKANLLLAYHFTPHWYFVCLASLLTGVPYILGQTGLTVQKIAQQTIGSKILKFITCRALSLNVPGLASADFWAKRGIDHVNVLHSSIDTDYFVAYGEPKEYDFMYIGRLEDYKGVHKIIQAMSNVVAQIPEARLAIVGYGSQEARLKQMAESLNLSANIDFVGFQKDTKAWLNKSKIFVMASDTEGLPCALMEAMSCELLCISSFVGNISDIIVDGETGFGFQAKDQKALETLMIQVYRDKEDLDHIRANARDMIVQHHSHQHTIGLWENLLDKVR